ncbi:hypothetical protein ACFRAR_11320 [Kitasatospora sp. NPDC056651]|uniref:hypothetical protein n=1 Tax=Kitasatospora sp. NPDC056651 TaxID=3345892 RepID=UPI00369DFF30
MTRKREDQELWDFLENKVKPSGLNGAGKANMILAWNDERQRLHERDERIHQCFDSVLAYVAMTTVLGVAYLLGKDGNTAKIWLAFALVAPAVAIAGKFLNRPVTQTEANMVSAGPRGRVGALPGATGGSPVQPSAPVSPLELLPDALSGAEQ